jgi:hypothetical protein
MKQLAITAAGFVAFLAAVAFFAWALSGCARSAPVNTALKLRPTTRDEMRAALYSAVFGLNQGLKTCSSVAMGYGVNGDVGRAKYLTTLCTDGMASTVAGVSAANAYLDAWDPAKSPAAIGCAVRGMKTMYSGMMRGLTIALGTELEGANDTVDGKLRMEWMSKYCATEL